jgi:hypothetical protein
MSGWIKVLIFTALLYLPLTLCVSPGMTSENEIYIQSEAPEQREGSVLNLGLWLASFYRDYISPVDGSQCPSLPSCSSYSASAFKKHGFFMGWIMTVDRLIHEGKEETSVSPIVYTDEGWKILDPVENNDFWWFRGDREYRE